MNIRILKDGTIVDELEKARTLKVKTKCPGKWMLIDMETAEVYIGHSTEGKNDWRKIDPVNWAGPGENDA